VNYRASIVLGALLAVGITGCDPYEDEKGGAPAVLGVTLAEGSHEHPIAGTDAGAGAWTVAGDENQQNALFITTNKLLDPATIQTSTNDCTPANGWLQVTGPAITCETGTPAWYSCYVPSSPSPQEGASIVVFQACEPVTSDVGYYDIGAFVPSSTYTLTGTVKDRSGADLPINITVTTAAEPPPAT
jgi:hypothetical protein